MGYYRTLTGSIEIKPALPFPLIENSRFLPEKADDNQLEVTYLIDVGWIPDRAVAIVSAKKEGEPYKACHIEEQLALIVDEVLSAGSQLSGYLFWESEKGDVEWYGLDSSDGAREIVSGKAVLSWPSGEEVDI
jgi:hypothetical protein